jgi:uncharacterized protein YeaC (DUF1315 family)
MRKGRTVRLMSQKRIRQAWIALNGPIPIDEYGVTFDIHHADFNPNNNDPSNWIALSVADHYAVHRENKDWYSALLISYRLKKKPDDMALVIDEAAKVSKKRVLSLQARENIAAAKRGKKMPPGFSAKISAINKGRKFPKEFGERISRRMKGRTLSPETIAKMVKAKTGMKYPNRKPISEEGRRNMSLAHKGKKKWPNGRVLTPEWLEKIRKNGEAARGKKKWPNGRTFSQEGMGAMRASAMKKKPRTPEVNAAIQAKRFATIAAKKAAQQGISLE